MSYNNFITLISMTKHAQFEILEQKAVNALKGNIKGTDTQNPDLDSPDKFRGMHLTKASVGSERDQFINGSNILKSSVDADYSKYLPGTNVIRPVSNSPQLIPTGAEGTDDQALKYLHHKKQTNAHRHKHNVLL